MYNTILDTFTETKFSDNRTKTLSENKIDEIIIGSTTIQTFTVPVVYSKVAKELQIIYNQGIETVLTLASSDVNIQESDSSTTIKITLKPDQTCLFKETCLNSRVQLKFVALDETVTYTSKKDIKIINPLDNGINNIN